MRVLGYNGEMVGYPARLGAGHDAAAALVDDGRVLAACEEERFSRKPHTGTFPLAAMEHCLRTGGIASLGELALICHASSPPLRFQPEILLANRGRMRPGTRLLFGAGLGLVRGLSRLAGNPELRSLKVFRKRTGTLPEPGRFRAVPHHLCHAASAFYPSPFEEALCLTLDAQGESASAMLAVGRGSQIHVLRQLYAPNSLGHLYACLTRYLGFAVGEEYKVSGLAPFGDAQRYRAFFERMVQNDEDGSFAVDPGWLSRLLARDALLPAGALYPRWMIDALGLPRLADEPILQRHADIAAALQEALERAVLVMLEKARAETGQRRLCLAGGVALNSALNGKIARSGLFEQVWVQPAAHDAGTALGAALYGYHAVLGGERQPRPRSGVFLGPDFGNASVSKAILEHGPELRCHRPSDIYAEAARAVAEGKVVAWVQGRSEWGRCALGHRSVLADPRRPDMKDRVNSALGISDGFPPLAPACLREHAAEWFELGALEESPFMLFAVPVRAPRQAQIPAVTHVDGSASVQTVGREDCPRFHALLRAFNEQTGVPVMLNTAFKVAGESLVNTPADAIRCFLASGIDLLVVGDTAIEKRAACRAGNAGESAAAAAAAGAK